MVNSKKSKPVSKAKKTVSAAVGICVEGRYLQAVKLRKVGNRYEMLDARLIELDESLDIQENPIEEMGDLHGDINLDLSDAPVEEEPEAIEINDETEVEDLDLEIEETGQDTLADDAGRFVELLQLASDKNARVALTLTEPQVYYSLFDSDWGLKQGRLRKRILTELAEVKEEYAGLKPDSLGYAHVSEDRLLAVVREGDIRLFNKFEEVKTFVNGQLPYIAFVESLELSLVNLVRHRYNTEPDSISAIVYIGEESSRFIFLKGQHIHHIAPVIADGISSPNISTTIASRFLLEMDTVDVAAVDTILLTGFAHLAGVEEELREAVMGEVHVEPVNLEGFDLNRIPENRLDDNLKRIREMREKAPKPGTPSPTSGDFDSHIPDFAYEVDDFAAPEKPAVEAEAFPEDAGEDLTPYAGAIGAALRSLDRDKKFFYDIDLTPIRIKEGQNKFVMTTPGWIILAMIPLIAGFTVLRSGKLHQEVARLRGELAPKQVQMVRFTELQDSIGMATERINTFERSFSVIDSLVVGTDTWTSFLTHLVDEANQVGGFWFTEMSTPAKGNTVTIHGYSIYRNRIPRFLERVGRAKLNRVEVQEIRSKRVYRFEIEVQLPRK